VRRQSSQAACTASTMALVSAADISGYSAIGSPLAGLIDMIDITS